MKISRIAIVAFGLTIIVFVAQQRGETEKMDSKKLTPEEERVIVHKGTEAPFSGKYLDNKNRTKY